MDVVETIETILSEDEVQAALNKIRENCHIIVNSCRVRKPVNDISICDNRTDAPSVINGSVGYPNNSNKNNDDSGYESHAEKASDQNIDELGHKSLDASRVIVDMIIQDIIDRISNSSSDENPLKRIKIIDPKVLNNNVDKIVELENVMLNPLWSSSEEDLCPPGEEDYFMNSLTIKQPSEHKIRIRKDLMPSFDFDSTSEECDTKDNSVGSDELEEGEYIEDFATEEEHGLQMAKDLIGEILVDDNSNITNMKKEDIINNAESNKDTKTKADQMMINAANDLNLEDHNASINSLNDIKPISSSSIILVASNHDLFKEDLHVEDVESLKGVDVAPLKKTIHNDCVSERQALDHKDTKQLLSLGGWISPSTSSNDNQNVSVASLTNNKNKDSLTDNDEYLDEDLESLRSVAVASLRNVTNQDLPTVQFQNRSSTPINKSFTDKSKDSYKSEGSKRSSSRSMERERCPKQTKTTEWKKVSSFNSKDNSTANYSSHSKTDKNLKKSKSKKRSYSGTHISHNKSHNEYHNEYHVAHWGSQAPHNSSQVFHLESQVSKNGSYSGSLVSQNRSQYESQYESSGSFSLSPISSRISARPSVESTKELLKVQSRLSSPKPSVFRRLGPPKK